jgi:GT2 family glycosyltransferase
MTGRAGLGVSIVVPSYNRGSYLDAWMRAVAAWQPFAFPVEVLVADDGGADHCEAVCDRWRAEGLDVRYLRVRPPGAPRNNAIARNAGIRLARWPLLLQSDPDIVFVTDVISACVAAWQPGVFCSVSRYHPLTRSAWYRLRARTGEATLADYRTATQGRQNMVHSPDGVHGLHGAFLCEAAVLRQLRGYDERFTHWGWEDADLLGRLRGLGLERVYVEGACVAHQWHPVLRDDDPQARAATYRAMAWQQARASEPAPLVRNPVRWGLVDDPLRQGDPDAEPEGEAFSARAAASEARLWRQAGDPQRALAVLREHEGRQGATTADDRHLMAMERATAAVEAGDEAAYAEGIGTLVETAGPPAAADLLARRLIAAGDISAAISMLEAALNARPDATCLSRLVEARIATSGEVRPLLDRARDRAWLDLDTFEQLRVDAYDHAARAPVPPWRAAVAGEPPGDFLLSAAGRAWRLDLPLATRLLCAACGVDGAGVDPELLPRARELGAAAEQAWAARVSAARSGQTR